MRKITHLPLESLWDESGPVEARLVGDLNRDSLRSLLRQGAVRFMIANVGEAPKWIPIDDCFDFWKTEAGPHLAPDAGRIDLDAAPDGYAYLASEWSVEPRQEPVVVLTLYH